MSLRILLVSLVLHSSAAGLTSDYVRPSKSNSLIDEHVIRRRGLGDCIGMQGRDCPGQVHIGLGGQREMVVSYATSDPDAICSVRYGLEGDALGSQAEGSRSSYSATLYFDAPAWPMLTHPNLGFPQPGASAQDMMDLQNTTSWALDQEGKPIEPLYNNPSEVKSGLGAYNNPGSYYDSPVLCTVRLTELTPGGSYCYAVKDDNRVFSFTMPNDQPAKAKTSLLIGLTADIGQTAVSNASMAALVKMKPDIVLLPGDLSYADGWHPRWDTFGMLWEQLAAHVPVMSVPGNHEVGDGENYVNYNPRYPMPHTQSGSNDNTYWSRDFESVHVIGLNSYAGTDSSSLMYQWLAEDMRRIDRARTPWVIVMMHTPFYNSNSGHQGEGILMQKHMEELLYSMGVDLVLNGHVHSYERTSAVHDWKPNRCGPVHLNLGDGGNREGAYVPWRMPQPAWSEFRESSFGVAQLEIFNSTHAYYSWKRHACMVNSSAGNMDFEEGCVTDKDNSADNMVTSDAAWITRPSGCANRQYTGDLGPRAPAASSHNGHFSSKWKHLAVFTCSLLGLACVGIGFMVRENRSLRDRLARDKDFNKRDEYLKVV